MRLNKQIRDFLFVLFFGALLGVAVVGSLLYKYSPTGQYKAGNVLLSPDTLERFTLHGTRYMDPRPGGLRYVFDKLSVEIYGGAGGKREISELPLDKYRIFYDAVTWDFSLRDNSVAIESFRTQHPLSLKILVKTESEVSRVLQEVQFSGQGYYRVHLLSDSKDSDWAYFQHPEIKALLFQSSRDDL